jgi:hypothetical protein
VDGGNGQTENRRLVRRVPGGQVMRKYGKTYSLKDLGGWLMNDLAQRYRKGCDQYEQGDAKEAGVL